MSLISNAHQNPHSVTALCELMDPREIRIWKADYARVRISQRATQVCWNSSPLTRYHQSFEQQGVPESAERKQNVYKDSTPAEESVTSLGFTYTDATLVPAIPTGFSDGLALTFWRIFRSTLIQGDSIVSTQSQAQEVVN